MAGPPFGRVISALKDARSNIDPPAYGRNSPTLSNAENNPLWSSSSARSWPPRWLPGIIARPVGRYFRPFPFYWLLGVAVVWVVVQLSWLTRDYKVMTTLGSAAAALIGLLVWNVVRGRATRRWRWGLVASAAGVALAGLLLLDFENDGDGRLVGWRFSWTPAPDQMLAMPDPLGEISVAAAAEYASYPGFLGGKPWAEVTGMALQDDWQANPPQEVWRQPIGAGWSAFAVADGLAVTQEQRGEQELIVAYRLEDGEAVWWHGDEARFDPYGPMTAMGGVGPRATPAIYSGRVVAQGATGILNCLDLESGETIWSYDLHEKFGAVNLTWGKSGSPLIVPDDDPANAMVIVPVGASADAASLGELDEEARHGSSLVAFDLATGDVRWAGGGRMTSYASPSIGELAGRRQVLQVNHHFLTGHDASTGEVLWETPWLGSSGSNASCSQAIALPGDRVFVSKGYAIGSSLLKISESTPGEFTAEPIWYKRVLKTKFGNVVVRDGYVYGIDGIALDCVELATGKRMWKKRRRPAFGHGQMLLVGKHLLILTEQGELVLADASPEKYVEQASLQALSDEDVTWNNPALAGEYLLLRNAKEAVCYKLAKQAVAAN